MADGISINVGTEGSSLDNNKISIGDTAGGNIDKRLSDYFRDELRDLKDRVKTIETFLAGNAVGQPGLTAQVADVVRRIANAEREIEIIDMLESRLDRIESLILGTQQTASLARSILIGVVIALAVVGLAVAVGLLWAQGRL